MHMLFCQLFICRLVHKLHPSARDELLEFVSSSFGFVVKSCLTW